MLLSLDEVFKILETAPDKDAVRGLVGRYTDQLATTSGVESLIERLELRRRALNRFNGMLALIDNLRWQKQADMRHDLEAATQAVLRADNPAELAVVGKHYPIVFTQTMMASLKMLQEEAAKAGDAYTTRLATHRLRTLQMIVLANAQGMELTHDNLRILVTRILEAESLRDLLDVIEKNPVVLAEAFDLILTEMGQEGARAGKRNLPKVTKLRIDVLNGVRRIVEAVLHQHQAEGSLESSVEELNSASSADHFLDVVARYPFILGEDFQNILVGEMEKARDAGEEKAAEGIFRRMGHLKIITNIVMNLNKTREMAEAQLSRPYTTEAEGTTGRDSVTSVASETPSPDGQSPVSSGPEQMEPGTSSQPGEEPDELDGE